MDEPAVKWSRKRMGNPQWKYGENRDYPAGPHRRRRGKIEGTTAGKPIVEAQGPVRIHSGSIRGK